MTTKKQEIRRLQRTVQHLRARIEELNELVGTERGRAEVLDNTAGFWEHQCGLWKKKAQALEAALEKEKRKSMDVLQPATDGWAAPGTGKAPEAPVLITSKTAED